MAKSQTKSYFEMQVQAAFRSFAEEAIGLLRDADAPESAIDKILEQQRKTKDRLSAILKPRLLTKPSDIMDTVEFIFWSWLMKEKGWEKAIKKSVSSHLVCSRKPPKETLAALRAAIRRYGRVEGFEIHKDELYEILEVPLPTEGMWLEAID